MAMRGYCKPATCTCTDRFTCGVCLGRSAERHYAESKRYYEDFDHPRCSGCGNYHRGLGQCVGCSSEDH